MSRKLFSYVAQNTPCPQHDDADSAFECAVKNVRDYLNNYSGALFDPDPEHQPWYEPNVLKGSDVSCVAHLSMWSMADACKKDVDVIFARDLELSANCPNSQTSCDEHLHCLLKRIPAGIDIFTAPSTWIDTCFDFYKRCRILPLRFDSNDRTKKWGDAAVSKLLARKRPALVPVMDSVAAARYPEAKDIHARWTAFQEEVQEKTSLESDLGTLHSNVCAATPWISPLRLLDIVVWMHK